MRRRIVLPATALAVIAAAGAAAVAVPTLPARSSSVPTARVIKVR